MTLSGYFIKKVFKNEVNQTKIVIHLKLMEIFFSLDTE